MGHVLGAIAVEDGVTLDDLRDAKDKLEALKLYVSSLGVLEAAKEEERQARADRRAGQFPSLFACLSVT